MSKKKEIFELAENTLLEGKVLVIDLECSCWRGHPPKGQKHEIIEIGICVFDLKTNSIEDREGILVKNNNSEISDFCTELTSITQEMIDEEGIEFSEACELLQDKFLSKERAWFSWGDFDRNMFLKECDTKGEEYPLNSKHFNAKKLFGFKNKMKNDPGVQRALKSSGMKFEGTHHRGVDDAVNIARLVGDIFKG